MITGFEMGQAEMVRKQANCKHIPKTEPETLRYGINKGQKLVRCNACHMFMRYVREEVESVISHTN